MVLPALLGGKRRVPSVSAGTDSSPAVSPEKSKRSDEAARSRTTGLKKLRSPSTSDERPASPTFAGGMASPGKTRIASSNGMVRGSSKNDIHANGSGQALAHDGTPLVFDHSSDYAHSSRAGNLSLDEASLARRSTMHGASHLHDSINREPHDPRLGRSATISQSSPSGPGVGEGSLSLDSLIRSSSGSDLLTPRPYSSELGSTPIARPRSELFGDGQNSTVATSPTQFFRQSQQYPPVFEHSDAAGSSSSSSANSPVITPAMPGAPLIQIEKIPTREEKPIGDIPVQRGPSLGASLRPFDASTRPRSGSASSARSSGSTALDKPRSRKDSRKAKGIAGALALSGVALAAPAPGLSQPLHFAGREPRVDHRSLSRRSTQSDAGKTSDAGPGAPQLLTRSSEEASGYDSPTPISHYGDESPPFSPSHLDTMVSLDALGDFDDVMEQLGPGYALASAKRNADFHTLFKNVPEDDYLIEDYGCALQREILIQGRLYISEHHLCFNANIFGWVTTVILPFSEIIAVEKRNTALVIPNAIHVATMHARHNFASFLSRDMTYDLIVSLWRNQHPVVPQTAALPDTAATDEEADDFASNLDDASGKKSRKKRDKFKRLRGISNSTGGDSDHHGDVPDENDRASPNHLSPSPGRAALVTSQTAKKTANNHAPTQCNCLSGGSGHYANTVMDSVFPGSPEKIYNLMFMSGFMRDFLVNDMKVMDLQIGEWAPSTAGSHLLSRSYQYIKPLNASVGPKSAKVMLVDENLRVDFDNFVITLTTSKTPDVPSGGSFAVKTKTCIMWSKHNHTRVLVTTTVEWSGRSFLKSIIDRSSIDGQKQLYDALEKAMRGYIAAHKSEFYIGGDQEAEIEATVDAATGVTPSDGHIRETSGGTVTANGADEKPASKDATKEPLAFVTKRVPAARPLCEFCTTVWDTAADFVGQMSLTALICSVIIFVLVVSNLFTLTSLRTKSSRYQPSYRPPPDYSTKAAQEGEQYEVAAAVRGVLQEYFSAKNQGTPFHAPTARPVAEKKTLAPAEELAEIRKTVEQLEERLLKLRLSLAELD